MTHTPLRPRPTMRANFNLPLIGQMARDIASGGVRAIWYGLAFALLLLVTAVVA